MERLRRLQVRDKEAAKMSSEGYEFSAPYHAQVFAYSPGTTFLATAFNDRVIIRSTASLQIIRTWQCRPSPASHSSASSRSAHASRSIAATKKGASVSAEIDSLEWSPDSMYLLAYSSKAQSAWVFALTRDGDGVSGEIAKLDGGVDGLVKVEWGKKAEVLAWSDHALKMTIWDLTTGDGKIIQSPKSHTGCHAWNPDGRYLAIVERHAGKEFVGIYDSNNHFGLLRHFPLRTSDAQGLSWSHCGRYIAAYESPLQYAVHLYSPLGPHLCAFSAESTSFSIDRPADRPPEDPGMGIRSLHWAPGGKWMALAGWDGKVRILESESGRCIGIITPPTKAAKGTTIWREPEGWIKETRGRGIVQFDRLLPPAALPTLRPDLSSYPPRSGIAHLSFSSCGTLLYLVCATQPSVVHIYTFLPDPAAPHPHIRLAASLLLSQSVRGCEWAPKGRRLVVWTRTGGVYFWDRHGWVDESESGTEGEDGEGGMMEGVGVPARTDFVVASAQWAPDGTSLVVAGKDQFCVLYDPDAAEAGDVSLAEREMKEQMSQNPSWARAEHRGAHGLEEGAEHSEGLSEVLEEESFWAGTESQGGRVLAVGA